MNSTLQNQPANAAIAPGMLGCGVRLPDSTCSTYSFHEQCPSEHLDRMLHQLAETMAQLQKHGLPARRLVWTFDRCQLFAIARPDGALLVLVAQSNSEAAENADQLAEEFFSLNLPAHC